jgi:hypothetical protein
MGQFFTLLQWTVVAAMVYAIVTHGTGVGNIIENFGSFWTGETKALATGA